jgi:hypothetical protein
LTLNPEAKTIHEGTFNHGVLRIIWEGLFKSGVECLPGEHR